jgi:hypothetical protein
MFLEEHKQRFLSLPQNLRHGFIWDVGVELLKLEVHFEGLDDPPGLLFVHSVCYLSDLSRDLFSQRCLKVQNAVQLVKWRFLQFINEPFTAEISEATAIN